MNSSAPNRKLVMLGAGGHARVVHAVLRAQGVAVSGCVALAKPDPALWPRDVPYLGDREALGQFDCDEVLLVNGIGSAGPIAARRDEFERAREAGFRFRGVRHDSVTTDASAEIDETALIMAGAIVQPGAKIGANVLLNTGAMVDHDCEIGAHCHIATGARLAGNVIVGESVHVGAGATIIQGVRIGAGAVVAAGAAVIRDVEAGSLHGGVPAKPLAPRGK